jgi:hypothetical protein
MFLRAVHPIRNHQENDYDCRSDEKDFFLIKLSIVRHAANLLGVRQNPIVELSSADCGEISGLFVREPSCVSIPETAKRRRDSVRLPNISAGNPEIPENDSLQNARLQPVELFTVKGLNVPFSA